MREGVERFMITDINNPGASAKAQSTVWIYFDTVTVSVAMDKVDYNHIPGGANVLYMDGHVEWAKSPQTNGSKAFMVTSIMQSAVRTNNNPFP